MAYKIGEKAHGGIVFSVDESGEHGLVAAETDQSTKANWADAKKICSELDLDGFKDWFLPSKDQLNLMYNNLYLKGLGGFVSDYYWSSTEGNVVNAWQQNFSSGVKIYGAKDDTDNVRAVRAF